MIRGLDPGETMKSAPASRAAITTVAIPPNAASSIGTTELAHDYEYHLQSAGGRWFLASLLYVADDGKYECL